jgi:hypothetical protein
VSTRWRKRRPGSRFAAWRWAVERGYERRRRRRAARRAGPGRPPGLEEVADAEHLLAVFEDLRRHAGPAPGPDGLRYSDLSRSEAAKLLREISRLIRAGSYRPGETRLVFVPKPGGGRRGLRLGSVLDRAVAAALHRSLEPFWEGVFLGGSHGFRPGRSAWGLLADLAAVAAAEGRWVLATADVRRAFDEVRVGMALEYHAGHLDPPLLGLVGAVLRGAAGPAREVGIDQGSPYSPAALNVYLHHAHDVAFEQRRGDPVWLRYADDLTYLCRTAPEGRQALDLSKRLHTTSRGWPSRVETAKSPT